MQEANKIFPTVLLFTALFTYINRKKDYRALREISKHNFNQGKVSLV